MLRVLWLYLPNEGSLASAGPATKTNATKHKKQIGVLNLTTCEV